jgi:hypothetical protein
MPTFQSMDDVSFLRPVHIGTSAADLASQSECVCVWLMRRDLIRIRAHTGEPSGVHFDEHARLRVGQGEQRLQQRSGSYVCVCVCVCGRVSAHELIGACWVGGCGRFGVQQGSFPLVQVRVQANVGNFGTDFEPSNVLHFNFRAGANRRKVVPNAYSGTDTYSARTHASARARERKTDASPMNNATRTQRRWRTWTVAGA